MAQYGEIVLKIDMPHYEIVDGDEINYVKSGSNDDICDIFIERIIAMRKKKIILISSIMGILMIIIVCCNIFFPKYNNLEFDDNAIKCVTVISFNKRQTYTIQNSDDIRKIIEYLHSIKKRKINIYEKIMGEDTPHLTKMGYTIELYSNEAGTDADLIMEIKAGTFDNIIIDGKVYKLPGDENNIYDDLYKLIKYDICKE